MSARTATRTMKAFGEPVLVTRTHFINDIDTLTRGSCSMMRQRQTNLGCACQYAGMVGMCAPAVGLFVVALCPPSDRVNFAEESLSSRRRRVCNKRTYAPRQPVLMHLQCLSPLIIYSAGKICCHLQNQRQRQSQSQPK